MIITKVRIIFTAVILIVMLLITSRAPFSLGKGNPTVIDSAAAVQLSEDKYYRVTWVIDGDTIVIKVGRKSVKVRLIGVETPEIKDSDKLTQTSRRTRKSVAITKKLGLQARDFTKKLTTGKLVRLEYESDKISLDKYNRLLAYVFLKDGIFLNAELIKQGYGRIYRGYPFKYAAQFHKLEEEARAKKLGIWKDQRR